jgi:hypothetical protein
MIAEKAADLIRRRAPLARVNIEVLIHSQASF